MDGAGNLLLPTELMWHAAHVSSFLRAALLDVRTISELQSYRRLEFAATPDLEKALLESVSKLFEVGKPFDCLPQFPRGQILNLQITKL